MIPALLLTFGTLVPHDSATVDRVEVIELNHYHDDHAKHVFDQLIGWNRNTGDEYYHVEWWVLWKPGHTPVSRNYATGNWEATYTTGIHLRKLVAPTFVETWTQYDPELYDRQFWPVSQRKGLSK